jgi:signal recognition particle GTPase
MNLENFLNECIPKILDNKLKYYQELNNKINRFQKLENSLFKQKRLEKLSKEKSNRNALSSNSFKEKIKSELLSKKDEFIRIFKNRNVKELFTEIKEQLRNSELSIELLNKIAELLEFIKSSEIILYDIDLIRTL